LLTRRILLKVFPSLLWGSKVNLKTVLASVLKFLSHGRYERITTQNVMSGIKVSHFTWLEPNSRKREGTREHVQLSLKKHACVENLIQWIFNSFVVPLLKACFYITETGVHKNKILYYRKPIWRLVRSIGLQPLLGRLYKTMRKREVMTKLSTNQCIGVHDIRLLPAQKKVFFRNSLYS